MVGIVRAWPDAVGETVARNAWPARLARDGTLHVNTASSTWAFELGRLVTTILEQLRSELGETTPPALRFTLHRRLRKALIQLSAPEYAHLQVSEVAHKLGFSTSASFTRAFKTEFGIRPSEVRRDHQVGITALSTATAADEPLFAEWIHELG